MKSIVRLIFLLSTLQLTACSNPKAKEASDTPSSSSMSQEELNERHAANFLAAAKSHQKEGQTKLAIEVIQELLEKYPDSKAAVEGKELALKWSGQIEK